MQNRRNFAIPKKYTLDQRQKFTGRQLTAAAVKREVKAISDPQRALLLRRFFRTGPGEYGEGDRFLGLTVPAQRTIAKKYRDLPFAELETLLDSPWHEHRCIALLILVERHRRSASAGKLEIHRFYCDRLNAINNWDLVDLSAAALFGSHLDESANLLRQLIRSSDLWHRRIAIVSTLAELRAGRTELTFAVAEQLLDDSHDLIHKATGWLLREAGKRDLPALLQFLRSNYARLPRTALRYAIERLPPAERRRWLAGPVSEDPRAAVR